MLTNGQILQGNYRIVGLLGKGGMGSVYQAEHTRLTGRRFAIKENIPEPNADPETLAQLRDQFYVEAKTLASLDHPNLPKVSDYFTQGDNEYLVMDFVEGENLQQIFDRYAAQLKTALPEKSVLTWANQVLDALEYLHGQRPSPIVHRDIKPANIVLTPTGVVKLVDFGLVKLLDQSGQSTAVALRGMGTPAYTALEQYPGTEAHTDARTDIYALGATLYHLLTGQPPANVRDRLLNPKVLEKPRRINPSISAATEAAVLKAIEVHPDQRFQSAAQMHAALGGKAVVHSPAAAPKRRWVVPVAMLAILLLLAAAAWAWYSGMFPVLPVGPSTPGGGATIVAAGPTTVIVAEAPTTDTNTPLPPVSDPTTIPTEAPAEDTATPTAPIEPTSTPEPTNVPTATSIPTETPTETPSVPSAVANGETNLRSGPGTDFSVAGSLAANQSAEIVGKNQAGTWWQIKTADGKTAWVIASRVVTSGLLDTVAVIATPTPVATATPSRPDLVADFESGPAWTTGNQKYGSLTPSREQAVAGASSGRLNYDFPADAENYVVLLAPRPIRLNGQPTGITAWVYGDGKGHYLNAWVDDNAGERRAYSFGQVSHTGWQQMTAWLDDSRGWPNGNIGGSDNGRLDYPANLAAVVFDGVPDGQASSGVIYLDEMLTTQAALTPPTPTPASVPVAPTVPATRSAVLPDAPGTAQTAKVGGLLGFGALLGSWLVVERPRAGRRRRGGR